MIINSRNYTRDQTISKVEQLHEQNVRFISNEIDSAVSKGSFNCKLMFASFPVVCKKETKELLTDYLIAKGYTVHTEKDPFNLNTDEFYKSITIVWG